MYSLPDFTSLLHVSYLAFHTIAFEQLLVALKINLLTVWCSHALW